jgi:hypothetical protein
MMYFVQLEERPRRSDRRSNVCWTEIAVEIRAEKAQDNSNLNQSISEVVLDDHCYEMGYETGSATTSFRKVQEISQTNRLI